MAVNSENNCICILANMLNKSFVPSDMRLPSNCVDYLSEEISYEQFIVRYLLPNRPCLLGKWVTSSWRSVKEWIGDNGLAHFANLTSLFGELKVPVAQCDAQEEYGAHPKIDMSFADYMAYLSQMRQYKSGVGAGSVDCEHSTHRPPLLYLKDWHFVKLCADYDAYKVPVFFQHDWLNEYWDSRPDISDDYRFVYIGPKNSWTPFHADVFRSYSWSANVTGCKRWLLVPPGEESKLKDPVSGRLVFDLTQANTDSAVIIEVIQHAGEVIFVPSGWHHQVYNLEETISINHNWINGFNADISWAYLKGHLGEVMHEIDHLRDMEQWDEQCQLILRASAGIDYREFYAMLRCIVGLRMKQMASHLLSIISVDDQDSHSSMSKSSHAQPHHEALSETLSSSTDLSDSESLCESDLANLTDNCVKMLTIVQRWIGTYGVLFEIVLACRLLDSMLQTEEFSSMDWSVDCTVIHPQVLAALLRRLQDAIAAALLPAV